MAAVPWQFGNVPGPRQAVPASAETMVGLIRTAKSPLIVAGSLVLETKVGEDFLIDVIVKLGRNGIPVVATAHTLKGFLERGFDQAVPMGIVDLANRLTDPTWGIEGKGPHDLVVFSGVQYPLLSQILSALKHFATNLRTISLDRFFQPNADWSFPNLKEEEWTQEILKIVKTLNRRVDFVRRFPGRSQRSI